LAGIVFVFGLTLFVPAGVSLIFGETQNAFIFIGMAIIVTVFGLVAILKHRPSQPSILEATVIAALAWLLISFVGALPYVFIAKIPLLDAYFEAMSGFTTTGMTLIGPVEQLPYGLLFWRAFTQWLGGVGIILLFLLFIPHTGLSAGGRRLYHAEAREERATPRLKDTIKRVWIIYAVLTGLCALLLWIAGLNWFDAIAHSFTTLSTGGFSTQTMNIQAFQNPTAEIIIILFMILAATNYMILLRLFTGKASAFIKSVEWKFMLAVITIFSLIIAWKLFSISSGYGILASLRISVFQTVSIITTTGYTTTDFNIFSSLPKVLITILMFFGGNLSSTAGALKTWRIIALGKMVAYTLMKIIMPPGTVRPLKIGGRVVEEEEIIKLGGFFIAYLLLITILTIMLSGLGFEPFSAFSGISSAVGNIGPSFLPISSSMLPIAKIILIIGMWAGRLEIIPILILLSPSTWRELNRLKLLK